MFVCVCVYKKTVAIHREPYKTKVTTVERCSIFRKCKYCTVCAVTLQVDRNMSKVLDYTNLFLCFTYFILPSFPLFRPRDDLRPSYIKSVVFLSCCHK